MFVVMQHAPDGLRLGKTCTVAPVREAIFRAQLDSDRVMSCIVERLKSIN